jgi:hypothetical protein
VPQRGQNRIERDHLESEIGQRVLRDPLDRHADRNEAERKQLAKKHADGHAHAIADHHRRPNEIAARHPVE